VGRPKHLRVLAGALEGDVFIGQRAQELRGLLKIRYPLEHGIVTDWDDMERIWEWVYAEGLKTLSEEVSSVSSACSSRGLKTGRRVEGSLKKYGLWCLAGAGALFG
jgi:hypothetical protein